MSITSMWNQVRDHAVNCWTGNPDMDGSTAGVLAEGASHVPGVGALVPSGEEASSWTNRQMGHGPHRETQGNIGNHVGTVVGGLAGAASGLIVPGGLGGAAVGMNLGSRAGGWLANQF
jgi:hypothetical protein